VGLNKNIMGGQNFTYQKKVLIFGAAVVAFFILHQEAYAFGHPDVISPTVEITGPEAGAAFKQTPPIISYNATDSYGTISECTVYVKETGTDWTRQRRNISCQEGENKLNTSDWCGSEGTNACGIRIEIKDKAGHISRDERFFTIDKTPPVIEISSNRSHPTQKTDVTFKFSVSDAYGIRNTRCTVDAPGGTLKDCRWRETYLDLPDGLREFTASTTDKAGNTASKKLVWEIDSTPPAAISDIFTLKIRESESTYFSQILDWIAPKEDGFKGGASTQYDIRYSVNTINETNWDDTTALVYREPQPESPGSSETMTIGPASESDLEEPRRLGILSKFNLLSAETKHYFAIKTRDEKWNWSAISSVSDWTDRDPCDYDADRLYSPKDGCGPRKCDPNTQTQTCDLYDNPREWQLPKAANEHEAYDWEKFTNDWPTDSPDNYWIEQFGATTKDLDQDGEDVAKGRLGVNVGISANKDTKEVTGYPDPEGRDWYDNPFSPAFFKLVQKPLLKQLSYTINDLDLDTFVSKDWDQRFASTEKTDTDLDDKFNADIVLEEARPCYR